MGVRWVLLWCCVFKVITDDRSARGFVHFLPNFLNARCIVLKVLFNPLEFLVSELQAAHIIKHKDVHCEEKTTGEESEKEQRVEDLTEFCQEYEDDDKDRRKAEMQAEWILLLHALDMDPSSQFTDVLSEVSLIKDRRLYV